MRKFNASVVAPKALRIPPNLPGATRGLSSALHTTRALRIVLGIAGLTCAFSVSAHAASTHTYVLELNDLRPGYVQTVSKPLVATKPGQIGGYETDFKRTTFSGVADIEDQAYTYRSAAYAHAGYLRSIAALKASRPFKHHSWQPMSSSDIGNVREAFTVSGTGNGWPLTYAAIVFQRKSAIGIVIVGGVTGFDPGKAVELASVMDHRMRSY